MFIDVLMGKEISSSRYYVFLFLCSVAGLLLSLYLTYEDFAPQEDRACDIASFISCSKVLDSRFSRLFGTPVAILGVSWYLIMLAFSYVLISSTHHRPEYIVMSLVWNISGLVFVVYLIVAEFIVGALCPFCTAIHLLTCIQTYLSYKILATLLNEKAHLRKEDLYNATIIASKPWLPRIAFVFIVPLLIFSVSDQLRQSSIDNELADALGVMNNNNNDIAVTAPLMRLDGSSDNNSSSSTLLLIAAENKNQFVSKAASTDTAAAAAAAAAAAQPKSMTRIEQLTYLLDCLRVKNVRMFGSFRCSHCIAEKKMFSPVSIESIYVECTIPVNSKRPQKHQEYETNPECKKFNVTGYPTFIQFRDKEFTIELNKTVGQMTPAELALNYDCRRMHVAKDAIHDNPKDDEEEKHDDDDDDEEKEIELQVQNQVKRRDDEDDEDFELRKMFVKIEKLKELD